MSAYTSVPVIVLTLQPSPTTYSKTCMLEFSIKGILNVILLTQTFHFEINVEPLFIKYEYYSLYKV